MNKHRSRIILGFSNLTTEVVTISRMAVIVRRHYVGCCCIVVLLTSSVM